MAQTSKVAPMVRRTPSLVVVLLGDEDDQARPISITCTGSKCSWFSVHTTDPSVAKWAASDHQQRHARAAIEAVLPAVPA